MPATTTQYTSKDGHYVITEVENTEPRMLPLSVAEPGFDQGRLLRRIDLRVMPMLFLIYVAAFLDRVNISNALTMSLPKDLGLVGEQPNIALTIFFVPYIIFEIPSNILLKRFRPHIWLSCCIMLFGVVMLCQGFVRSYDGLLATRFFLGLAEAGLFPGTYLISFWYGPSEIHKRLSVYLSSVIIAGAFGSLIATGISHMNGIRGLANWRWIFIVEGTATVLIGIMSFFLLADFPDDATWLTEEEKQFILVKTNAGETRTTPVEFRDVVLFFKKAKNILVAVMYLSIVVPIYAFAYFTPTIVQSLGYSIVQTQLHSVPPFAASVALCLITAYISDKIQLRYPFIILGYSILISGLAILMSVHGREHFSAEYAGICLVSMGAFCAGASIICWYLMNLQGHVQRSIGSAWTTSFGNIGGIIAAFAFIKKDAPRYHTGYSAIMSTTAAGVVAFVVYGGLVLRERRRVSPVSTEGKATNMHSL